METIDPKRWANAQVFKVTGEEKKGWYGKTAGTKPISEAEILATKKVGNHLGPDLQYFTDDDTP